MVETVDRYGLKTHFLRKHKKFVDLFLNAWPEGIIKLKLPLNVKSVSKRTATPYLHFWTTIMSLGIIIMPSMQSRLLPYFVEILAVSQPRREFRSI